MGFALISNLVRGPLGPPGGQLVGRALSQNPNERFATAAEMLQALQAIVQPASREEVGRVVRELAPQELALRAGYLRQSSPGVETTGLDPELRLGFYEIVRALRK